MIPGNGIHVKGVGGREDRHPGRQEGEVKIEGEKVVVT
jgi:hypothetical protein